jgi:hypothetical protein
VCSILDFTKRFAFTNYFVATLGYLRMGNARFVRDESFESVRDNLLAVIAG